MIAESDDVLLEARASLEAWLEFERFFGTPCLPAGTHTAMESGPEESSQDRPGDTLGASEEEVLERRAQELSKIETEASVCTRCVLHERRRHVVFGVGHPGARLVLVGEAPGYHEDMQGEPFVGRAGALLGRMLARLGLGRETVYICNVLKCRPPDNRDPTSEEKICCSPFLRRQLAVIQPELILALGAHAARTLLDLDPTTPLGRLRGRVHRWEGIAVIATYHPAYLLRNPPMRWRAMEDLQRVGDLLGLEIVETQSG